MSPERQVAIVTGAARPWGLGRLVATGLAEKGMDIAVADIREDWGQEAARAIQDQTGREVIYVKTDVSKRPSVKAMVDATLKQLGRIDVLTNIVGISANQRIDDMTDEAFDKVMNTNLRGTMLTCQAVLPAMREQGGGRIVNIASGGALQPLKGSSVYSASKAGVVIFTKILAWEVARDNVVATTVAPGVMVTAMGQEEGPQGEDFEAFARGAPFGKRQHPREVAEVVIFAATSATPALTGQTLHANSGGYMV